LDKIVVVSQSVSVVTKITNKTLLKPVREGHITDLVMYHYCIMKCSLPNFTILMCWMLLITLLSYMGYHNY